MTTQSDTERKAAALDIEIGYRLRQRRKDARLSQTQLAETIGVSFQQVQKYERGTNRVSSSAMILLCQALNCTPGDLLDDLAGTVGGTPHPNTEALRSFLDDTYGPRMMRAFLRLSHAQAKLMTDAVETIADAGEVLKAA